MTTTYPHWAFDDSPIADPLGHGERAVRFFDALRHPKSEHPDKRLGLAPFWQRIIRRIYGPRDAQGRRQVRTVFIMIARGARKTTTIGGGLGLYHAIGHEKIPMGQVLLAAGAEDQAQLGFDEAVAMVKATPALRKVVKIRGDYLEHPEAGSSLQVLSAEGDLSHGTTPACVLIDELHVFKNRKLWRALKTGLPKTPGTLLVITTTAGRGQTGLGWEEYSYARRVALGEITNPAYLPIIFEPPAGAKWDDERVWSLVNPGMSLGFPDLDELRQAALQAKEKPAERDDFKQYNLNFWLDQSLSPFVEMSVYDEGSEAIDLAALEGQPCWLAVDLSSNIDLTVIVAAWRDGADGYRVWAWFFCPAENLTARGERDGVPYPLWEKQEFITATPGNVIDYRFVEERIRELCDRFDVQEIAFDPHMAQQTMRNLTDDGLPCVEMRQGWVTMAPAIKELERAVVGRKFQHGGHPVLRWNFENVSVERDKAGNVSFHKGKSRDRIDGAVAAAMAVARASAGDTSMSIYSTPARAAGLRFI
jgi:phage terminase large subunit-like protein